MKNVECPEWLVKRLKNKKDPLKQQKIDSIFKIQPKTIKDIESLGSQKVAENPITLE